MSGIFNLLNDDNYHSPSQQSQQLNGSPLTPASSTTPNQSAGSSPKLPISPTSTSTQHKSNSSKPLVVLRDQIPKSKINHHILNSKKFVKLAIRRKYSTKKTKSDTKQSKLHIKSLKAGIKVKMTLSNNLFSLYHNLIPFTDNRKIFNLFSNDESSQQEYVKLMNLLNEKNLVCKSLQLINNNVVDLSEYSNKILKSFANESNNATPTFNSLDTALSSLFGTKEFTLVRITRSTTDDVHGSSILKLETATPGDFNLIDDEENSDEMLHSLGKTNEVPNNLFFKKIIARPRYKSNMKIYFIPEVASYSLYTDFRMLERDLFNGIVQLKFLSNDLNDLRIEKIEGYTRNIYCTFPCDDVLREYKKSLLESATIPQNPTPPHRSHSIDESLMLNHKPHAHHVVDVPRRPSLAVANPPSIPPFLQQQQYHQPLNMMPVNNRHHSFPSTSPPQVFNTPYSFPPPHHYQQQQQQQQRRPSLMSPNFVHLPPPPPPPVILPQTPRSATVREDVLGLLKPFNDNSLPSYQDMVSKRRMSINDA
ncbi:hypothetical protein SBY92_004123 [Candida maltosa Xu316]